MTSFDDRELVALAADLENMGSKTHKAVRGVFQSGAQDLKNEWRANATKTAGEHGRLYPLAIDWEEKISTSIHMEIGPDSDKPQGGMGPGFEFGSANQPPHLDGQLAADRVIPLLDRRIGLAVEDVFKDA